MNIAYDPMGGAPRGPRKRGLPSVLQRARGLLDPRTAYDYVFRASRHPSATQARLQAAGTVMLGEAGAEAAPLPRFEPEQLGDCIDCTLCVQVCPVGIDIRNGLQYECIACGACIDACDDVMDRMGMPRGLIRYTNQNALDGRPSRILRPRIFVYGALLALLAAGWGWGVVHRSPLIADVLRDRNALYQQQGDRIANGYTLKLVNKTDADRRYRVRIEPAQGSPLALKDAPLEVAVPAGAVVSQAIEVGAPAGLRGRHALVFVVEADDGSASARVDSTFFGPM
jgi:cytochrome c oxidase accessory protein FixG